MKKRENIIASMPVSLVIIFPVKPILLISKIAGERPSISKSLKPWSRSFASWAFSPLPSFPPMAPSFLPTPITRAAPTFVSNASPSSSRVSSKIFGAQEKLKSPGLDVIVRKIHFHSIHIDQIDSFFFRCPKLPSDTEARIGVRRNPKNPDKIEKIFGYNAIITTSIELSLGLELPVGCLTISGNAEEGNQFIPLKQQLSRHHPHTKIDLADAKYDELHNYE